MLLFHAQIAGTKSDIPMACDSVWDELVPQVRRMM